MVSCMVVAGARPNFMKIAPIMSELSRRDISTTLVHTGQHYDASMSAVFFDELEIPRPDHDLGIGAGSHAVQTARIMEAFEPLVDGLRPRIVVVVGDVNSTLACALVAAKAKTPVAHVEAGLRSGDWSMPEEINRVVTDRISRLLLAPSPDAVVNLRAEGLADSSIHLVGNVMVDTLTRNLERAVARPVLRDLGLEGEPYALVTLHRPSNVDDPDTFRGLLRAIEHVGRQMPVLWPAHPRMHARMPALPPAIRVLEPAGYLDFVAMQAGARLVLTDSGGVQEETTILGRPCLTLRTTTERPITIEQGTNQLAGTEPDDIIRLAEEILAGGGPPPRRPDLWDGMAAVRIVDALAAALDQDPVGPSPLPAGGPNTAR